MSGFTPKGEHEDTVDALVNATLEGQPVHRFPDPAYIAELEADRARLEFLARRQCQISWNAGSVWSILGLAYRDLGSVFWLAYGDQGYEETAQHPDWRAAIDKAMKAEGQA